MDWPYGVLLLGNKRKHKWKQIRNVNLEETELQTEIYVYCGSFSPISNLIKTC